jgi:AAA15 family ATPase/GTPase
LHYSVLKDVWKAIGKAARDFNVQVFATTHSFECIEAAQKSFKNCEPNEFRYHRLQRTKEGVIRAVTYTPERLESALDTEFEVR